ncbi:MAG: hypothetical protein M3372_02145, partial [Verrucomicrobiota bacterium]|nr:hypothetical protein [Verrucomicrobiota bacterium]
MTPRLFLAACAALIASAVWVGAQSARVPAPKSLEIVDEPHGSPWEGISSGGPLAVDQYGNRLAEPAAPAVVAPAVALDRRVSSN